MAFDASKPNTSQTIGDVILSANANDVALKAQQDAHEGNSSTAHGLAALLASQADYITHKANTTDAHGLDVVAAAALATGAELAAGRGTMANLADRLAVALTGDGAIRLSTLASKWIDNGDAPTYIDATHFSVPSDRTKVYIGGALLRLTISGSYAYAPVASAVFSASVTTVTLDPGYPILTSGVSKIELALIAWDNAVANACTTNAANITSVQGQVTSLKIERIDDWIAGKPAAGAVVKRFIAGRAFSIPSEVAGAQGKAGTAATGSAVFTLAKNGSAFGTATFAAAGTVPAWAAATATSFAAGDVLTLTAPGSQDATLADIAFTIPGVLP